YFFILVFQLVGWVKKTDIHWFRYFSDGGNRILLKNLKAGFNFERAQVLPDQLCRFACGFDKIDLFCSPAEGLNSHCARSGKKVEPDCVFNRARCGNDVEKGFTQTVRGRTKIGPG